MKDIYITLLFICGLLLLVMPRKVCKTIKGKRICSKKPKMSARDIITIQMNALQKNNRNQSGIKKAFQLASSDNLRSTGPYPRFQRMVQNQRYKHLLKSKNRNFVPNTTQKYKDESYSVIVKVISESDTNEYNYRFSLSRQIPTLFWRTDSVELIEGFSNSQLNVFDREIETCGTNPMTGWKRDGKCLTDENDQGTHTVCAKMTDEFLDYTKSRGNDLTSKSNSFPGLKRGDNWCLCSLRWREAMKAGVAPPLKLDATNKITLDYIGLDELTKYNN